jgi:hypothetical protein
MQARADISCLGYQGEMYVGLWTAKAETKRGKMPIKAEDQLEYQEVVTRFFMHESILSLCTPSKVEGAQPIETCESSSKLMGYWLRKRK